MYLIWLQAVYYQFNPNSHILSKIYVLKPIAVLFSINFPIEVIAYDDNIMKGVYWVLLYNL